MKIREALSLKKKNQFTCNIEGEVTNQENVSKTRKTTNHSHEELRSQLLAWEDTYYPRTTIRILRLICWLPREIKLNLSLWKVDLRLR